MSSRIIGIYPFIFNRHPDAVASGLRSKQSSPCILQSENARLQKYHATVRHSGTLAANFSRGIRCYA